MFHLKKKLSGANVHHLSLNCLFCALEQERGKERKRSQSVSESVHVLADVSEAGIEKRERVNERARVCEKVRKDRRPLRHIFYAFLKER